MVVYNIESSQVISDDMTSLEFIDWYTDSFDFENWIERKNYNRDYGIKRLEHDLKILLDYGYSNNKNNIEWNGYLFEL